MARRVLDKLRKTSIRINPSSRFGMYLTVVERCAAAGKVDDLLPQAMLELVQLERIADW